MTGWAQREIRNTAGEPALQAGIKEKEWPAASIGRLEQPASCHCVDRFSLRNLGEMRTQPQRCCRGGELQLSGQKCPIQPGIGKVRRNQLRAIYGLWLNRTQTEATTRCAAVVVRRRRILSLARFVLAAVAGRKLPDGLTAQIVPAGATPKERADANLENHQQDDERANGHNEFRSLDDMTW